MNACRWFFDNVISDGGLRSLTRGYFRDDYREIELFQLRQRERAERLLESLLATAKGLRLWKLASHPVPPCPLGLCTEPLAGPPMASAGVQPARQWLFVRLGSPRPRKPRRRVLRVWERQETHR